MPLTQIQNDERFIVRSLMAYLSTNVVTPYNTAVASSSYPQTLGIELEFPDDPEKAPVVPLLIIPQPEDYKDQVATGMGDGSVYKYKEFRMTCFPAITTENKPSVVAAAILRNYLDYAFGTGLYIPIYDYSVANPYPQVETAKVEASRVIKSPKSFAPLLAIEKHVFDYQLRICYPVAAING